MLERQNSAFAPDLKYQNTFAFDKSETLTPSANEHPSAATKKGMECGRDRGPEAGVYVGRDCRYRSPFVDRREPARSGVAQFRPGYNVPCQRPADHAGVAGQVPEWTHQVIDCSKAAEDTAHRQSGADACDEAVFVGLDRSEWQETPGLPVHAQQTDRCNADQPPALRRNYQGLGGMVGPRTCRVFEPFHPSQQTRSHVLAGRGHRPDLAPSRSQIDCEHHRVSGYYATQGRIRCASTFDDGWGAERHQSLIGQLRQAGKNEAARLGIRLVKTSWRQTIFCQENLTKLLFSLDNKVVSNFLYMAKFGTLAAGAIALTVAAGAAEQADAQASELTLPHPDGEIVIDVTRVALDTQMQILEQLRACLQEGFEFADADGNWQIEGNEQFDWDDERGFCAESARSDFRQATLREEIQMANAEQAELRTRTDEARAAISALTESAMAEIQDEGL